MSIAPGAQICLFWSYYGGVVSIAWPNRHHLVDGKKRGTNRTFVQPFSPGVQSLSSGAGGKGRKTCMNVDLEDHGLWYSGCNEDHVSTSWRGELKTRGTAVALAGGGPLSHSSSLESI
jgi:hypothetical protein